MNRITLRCPDDWHCHLRDGIYLKRTVADISTQFRRAVVMPNLSPPVTRVSEAQQYCQRIKQYIPYGYEFQPLMTLYLTPSTTETEILAAKEAGIIAYKLYPAGATTHSEQGISSIKKIYPLLETMQKINLPLLIHAEVTDPEVKSADREAVFIDQEFMPLTKYFPHLRMVFEHISTKAAVDFVTENNVFLAATITPHHLLLTYEDCLQEGTLSPYNYCLPIAKSEKDQAALIHAATSGNPKFFLGTDSAPHARIQKESAHPPAGIYNAPVALAIYAEIFDRQNALPRLEGFTSLYGPQFYQLPANSDMITLCRQKTMVPSTLPFGNDMVIPLRAGQDIDWTIEKL